MSRSSWCTIVIGLALPGLNLYGQSRTPEPSPFVLAPCHVDGTDGNARCGTYWVYEDRVRHMGRRIPLKVIVFPSRSATPRRDPMWLVSPGGPGSTNSELGVPLAWNTWWRDNRDVVLVDLRGTSGPNRLDCQLPGSDNQPQDFLAPLFPRAAITACRDTLSKRADLQLYTTPLIVDDLDEVRRALGYDKVNLWGASWGTRAVLLWLRMHPETVRSAIIEGIAPVSLLNPLPHARSAQDALELLFDECGRQPACHEAFPNVRAEMDTVVARLKRAPTTVRVTSAAGDTSPPTPFTWQQFGEALRVMTYGPPSSQMVPLLVHRAWLGDYDSFAQTAVASNRGLRQILRFGFLLSITCTEDVSRIDPRSIEGETRGTYLGDSRVREQMAACNGWPRGHLGAHYGDPVRSTVPVFVLSGTVDPVSPPHFGTDAARYLPNAVHVIAPGSHVPRGPCIVAMERAFLDAASTAAVDSSCVRTMELPKFVTTNH